MNNPMKKSILLVLGVALSLSALAQPTLTPDNIDQVVAAMTLHEKASMVVGIGLDTTVPDAVGQTRSIERLAIAPVLFADGPAGVRIKPTREGTECTFHCTSFPVGTALSSTWNTQLAREVGSAMGHEMVAYGIDVILGPALNIQRNPLCGRNFEYYSEDPYLSGLTGAAVVEGIQSHGVGACVKHYAANNQETNRVYNDSRVSERALREIYLKGFEIAIRRSHPWMVMSSYNKLNGLYTSTSGWLMSDVLRSDWGFEGVAVTDWGFNGTPPADQLRAENDLMMEGCPKQVELVIEAVENGTLSEAELDRSVRRILQLATRSVRHRGDSYSDTPDLGASAEVALRAAHESIVLLENRNSALPLEGSVKCVALFGNASYDFLEGGTGSGEVHEPYIISPAEGFEACGYAIDAPLADGYRTYIREGVEADFVRNGERHWFFGRFHPAEMTVEDEEIVRSATEADVAVITFSRQAGEAGDRYDRKGDFRLSDAERSQLERVSAEFGRMGKKVIVVLNVGGPVEVASWRELADAVLVSWQCGQEGGRAIADVISGAVCPSGHLPTTFPVEYADVPSANHFPAAERRKGGAEAPVANIDYTEYAEDIYVGYRHFDTFEKAVCYPFGYGLSYTDFAFGAAEVNLSGEDIVVSVDVANVGRVAGKEVVQLYVAAPKTDLEKPAKELRAFAKSATLAAGESERVELRLSLYDLASFDESRGCWVTEAGEYRLLLGSSVEDIKSEVTLRLQSEKCWAVTSPVHKNTTAKSGELSAEDGGDFYWQM